MDLKHGIKYFLNEWEKIKILFMSIPYLTHLNKHNKKWQGIFPRLSI